MTRDETLSQIDAHQADIRTLVASIRLCPEKPAVDAARRMLALREQMLATMRAYQAFKHEAVFDPVIAAAHPLQAATARRLKTSCVMAIESYRLHTTRWPEARMIQDWAEYVEATAAVSATIETHLTEERVMVAMLLAGNED